MSSYQPPTGSGPLIKRMRFALDLFDQRSGKSGFGPQELERFVKMLRTTLEPIYGKDGTALAAFPQEIDSTRSAREEFLTRKAHVKRMIAALEAMPAETATPLLGKRIFIGHGRSPVWRELKDFIVGRLNLPCDEFNRQPVAGYTTSERLQGMLSESAFAFLIMTAEEEHSDGSVHARMNVVHELGLFQGHLGIKRAIVLLEEGCSEFSNINGLSAIRFPRGDIAPRFEEIRRVLDERLL